MIRCHDHLFKVYFLNFGSIASLKPSPIKLRESTVMRIHKPGNTTIHHAEGLSLPELINDPQVSILVGTPTPINESDDSIKIALATPIEIAMNAGAIAFGNA